MSDTTTAKQAFSLELGIAIRILDNASELAEMKGWPSLARDLAIALVTVQRARADFNRDDETDKLVRAHGLTLGSF